jgi:hypothetical protein
MLDNQIDRKSIGHRMQACDHSLRPEDWDFLSSLAGVIVTSTSSTEKTLLFTDAKMLVEYWERLNEDSGVKVSDEDQEILDVIHPECDMTLPDKEENDEEGNE